MECVYREGESTGFVRFDHLGHTCNASKGYIRPSVWLRYGGITRDWLVESMLSQPCKFESKKIHIEFTPETVRLHNVIQKMHMAASLLKEKFEFSFSVHCVSGDDLLWRSEGIRLNSGRKVLELNGVCRFSNPRQAKRINAMTQSDQLTIVNQQHKNNLESFNRKIWETDFPLTQFELDESAVSIHMLLDFCVNATDEAAAAGATESIGISGTVSDYLIRSVECDVHPGITAVAGDNLSISVWVGERKRALHFTLKVNETNLGNLTFHFFDSIKSENSKF